MAVVFYHVWQLNVARIMELELPEPFRSLVAHGDLGVPIFFVLSGFVIAHSVYAARITPRFFGLFVVRRSLRLDPPYWASIALAIGALQLSATALGRTVVELPAALTVVVNAAYLQLLLDYPSILGVYWTLCYEVQLYFAYVFLLGVVQGVARMRLVRITPFGAILFAGLLIASLLVESEHWNAPRGVFIRHWYEFFAGVCAYWAFRGFVPVWALLAALAAILAAAESRPWECATAAVVAALLFAASRSGHLWTFSGGRVLQALGRWSYSLYLTHLIVGTRVARLCAERVSHPTLTTGVATLLFAVAVSVAFAAAFYWTVERPALRLAQRIRLSP